MNDEILPSEVSEKVSRFDRFATAASGVVSRAPFFFACVLLVLVWAPSRPLWGNGETWQLVINTTTTIITFLLVALLQNAHSRSDKANQHKLNAVADALADLMEHLAGERDLSSVRALTKSVDELRAAVGLEQVESA